MGTGIISLHRSQFTKTTLILSDSKLFNFCKRSADNPGELTVSLFFFFGDSGTKGIPNSTSSTVEKSKFALSIFFFFSIIDFFSSLFFFWKI